jgi:hypothetical protein
MGVRRGNGATVEPLRHRQTKGAETDMFDPQKPRHIGPAVCGAFHSQCWPMVPRPGGVKTASIISQLIGYQRTSGRKEARVFH